MRPGGVAFGKPKRKLWPGPCNPRMVDLCSWTAGVLQCVAFFFEYEERVLTTFNNV